MKAEREVLAFGPLGGVVHGLVDFFDVVAQLLELGQEVFTTVLSVTHIMLADLGGEVGFIEGGIFVFRSGGGSAPCFEWSSSGLLFFISQGGKLGRGVYILLTGEDLGEKWGLAAHSVGMSLVRIEYYRD